MSRIMYSSDMARVVPFTDARATLSDLLDLIENEQEHVVITRNGKPVVIMMSVDEWESWEETIDVLSDPEAMDALRASEEDVKAGRLVDLDEVLRRYGGA
jgi:antitoxin YefM